MAIRTYLNISARIRSILLVAGSGVVVLLGLGSNAWGQTDYYFRDPGSNISPLPAPAGPDGDWNIDDNWWDGPGGLNLNFIPDFSQGAGERAIIENGGTAFVNADNGISPGRIILGSAGGTSGRLEVQSGGVLNVMQGSSTNGGITVGSTSGVGMVDVLPGGTLAATGPIAQGNNSANRITVGAASGAAATLTGDSATIRSRLQIFPNAAVSTTGTVTFTGSSNYEVEITGVGSSGKFSAGSSATLGGNLTLNFDGFSPSAGSSWTFLEATTFLGNFASVTSNNANLAFNEAIIVSQAPIGGGRVAMNASVSEVLVLQVDRNTGAVAMTHPGSTAIQLDGYFIGSNGGLLSANPAAWTSLKEGGQLGSDWIEQAQTVNNIGELKIGADANFGSAIPLGNVYNALGGAFGSDADDLQFRYRRASDGAEIPGIVQYTGTKVNNLLLQVDPTGAGDAYLRNTSATTVQIDAYEILSAGGSLSTSGWNSLDEQNATDDVWLEVLDNGPNQLAEVDTEGFVTLAPGASYNLGALFTGGVKDLRFNFLMMGQDAATTGAVIYEAFTPSSTPGDFNEDGFVDAADYTTWRDNLGAASLPNDNGLGVVGTDHYNLWKSQFGQPSVAGAVSGSEVPEPAAWTLCAAALCVLLRRRPARSAS
ncbi:hypothetical protein Pla175_31660 [Pirellulimonas nuda]|uniref:PEP-CTERM protein-sorting domain-containing protein n=1 Tax=Pirellulimonas nuda TaxID=2528009 RepID=A0A518DE66_9BACT|nr:hypothetical protein [Pirellulimonas nuda]QDU89771.1 hypothetical protein Pla175_31660 [Pirellulimonas nuda]